MVKRSYVLPITIGVAGLLGGTIGYAVVSEDTYKSGYRRGFADGQASCSEPSRLERAAGWLAR